MDSDSTEQIALMSIRPEFALRLMAGDKLAEFRRAAPTRPISHVVVYASHPVSAIIGMFEVARIDEASPHRLWQAFSGVAGIGRDAFFKYFSGRKSGFALVVKKTQKLKRPVPLGGPGLPTRPPQSFMYLDSKVFQRLFVG